MDKAGDPAIVFVGVDGVVRVALGTSGAGPPLRTLTVKKTGQGSITSEDGGIACGSTCQHIYQDGASVTLHANPSNGSTFKGWSGGGCSGTGTCVVQMSADETVMGSFTGPATPPDTKITKAKIDGVRNAASFTFTGSGGTGTLTFLCKLDKSAFKTCTSPKSYKGLKAGSHTFLVEAKDSHGVTDASPAKKKFSV
jgi:hypothetical protein